jgi:antitoxin component of RelBE/YafQ-DinJ toxin-antitoxin module
MVLLTVKDNSEKAKLFLEFAKSLSFVEVSEVPTPNKVTAAAIKEAKSGKVTKANSVKDLFDKLKS